MTKSSELRFALYLRLVVLAFLLFSTALMAEEKEEQGSRFKVSYGLWADLRYMDSDYSEQETFFKPDHLNLYSRITFSKRWSAFGEVAMERDPDLQGRYETDWEVERLFVEYRHHDSLQFRVGKIDSRLGIIKPIHWLITLDSIQQPLMEDNSYLPAKVTGLEIFGSHFNESRVLRYSITLSHSENEITDDQPIDNAKSLGLDLSWGEESKFLIGGSAAMYRDPKNKDRLAIGAMPYGEWWLNPKLLLRSEYLYLRRENGPDIRAWYAKAKWLFADQFYLNLRHDQGHDERSFDGQKRESQTLTLGYRLGPHWRFRAEVSRHNVTGIPRDITQWQAWAGWIF